MNLYKVKYVVAGVAVWVACMPHSVSAQYATSLKKKQAGDLIESTSYNDHKRGKPRSLQYLPQGTDFVCVNGKNRYTRALYGSPTAWRLETSDFPIFATYVKRDSRNIRFQLRLPGGECLPLEEVDWCESRYTPGRRSYCLKDTSWGDKAVVEIVVLASPIEEVALWRIHSVGLPEGTELMVLNAPIRRNKLSRSGDMGADPPGSFDPSEDGKLYQRLSKVISTDADTYVRVADNELSWVDGLAEFQQFEEARQELAGRIQITTPDAFLHTLGGALAVAADGIWGTEGVWLHGAVGWRMPLSGWRAAYTGDVLGWHDRARTHFDHYAASQVTEIPNSIPHPAQDTALALARSAKVWGTPQYSNGYICRNPQRNNQMHHYDMNLCYMDELMWHFNWTGDLEYARKMWPVITRHLAWEKLNYDPDNDGLYDAYACIWASDALYYNSGAVTHSTAYNYRGNRMAALIAEKIGEDPTPYKEEADKILSALNKRLWIKDRGHWAEFQDFMGHKRIHGDAGVWTIYHAIDSEVGTPFQSYLATRYVDEEIPHIAIEVADLTSEGNASFPEWNTWKQRVNEVARQISLEKYATVATTDWMPYSWSINNVAFAEVMHTALSLFQAGRAEAGYKLLKSSVLDGMYLGESPGNFGQISFYDAARGECYRDFGDPIGVASRLLVQGLYGVLPDALNGRLLIKPGFPVDWEFASLHTPDLDFDYQVEKGASVYVSHYKIKHQLSAVHTLELQIPARRAEVEEMTVNGQKVTWRLLPQSIESPLLAVQVPAGAAEENEIRIVWKGEPLASPQLPVEQSRLRMEGPVTFVKMEQGSMSWWAPLPGYTQADTSAQDLAKASVSWTTDASKDYEAVKMDKVFNAQVTDIFRNEYLSPRSPYTTLQLPKQGIGEWCHPLKTAYIDDTGLRTAVRNGVWTTPDGIPFRTSVQGKNIAFSSLWDNYPDSLRISLSRKAEYAYLLMAGSTNHMQCHMENATVKVYYKDGTFERLPLINPINWAPIEQLFFEDGKSFNRQAPSLCRVRLKTGEVSRHFGEELGFPGVSREVDGGAAVLLRMPLNKEKRLSHLVLETLSNEVVVGIMGVTLQR